MTPARVLWFGSPGSLVSLGVSCGTSGSIQIIITFGLLIAPFGGDGGRGNADARTHCLRLHLLFPWLMVDEQHGSKAFVPVEHDGPDYAPLASSGQSE